MNCRQVQSRLSEYIDTQLTARDMWEMDRHLAECRACAASINELRKTVAVVRALPEMSVSSDFTASLNARLADVQPKSARRSLFESAAMVFRPRTLPAWGAAAACAMAVVMLVPRPAAPPTSTRQAATASSAPAPHAAALVADPFEDIAAANLAQTTESAAPGASL
jgi:anti-sigma factor RsiW